jgi:hypothetical protein
MIDLPTTGIRLIYDMVMDLIKGCTTQKASLFQSHIEPLQLRILEIHKEYIQGFSTLRKCLKERLEPPSTVLEFLKERRREYAMQRDLMKNLAKELENVKRLAIREDILIAISKYCEAILA